MRFRHYGLLIGLLTVIFSFLWFAQPNDTYIFLLLAGLLISFLFLILILASSDTWKAKLFWIGIVILGMGANYFSEGYIVDLSCRIYLTQHEKDIESVKSILLPVHGDVRVDRNGNGFDSLLSRSQRADMKQLILNLEAPYIYRAVNYIHIELWGFLDSRFGLFYYETTPEKDKPLHHIYGNWYR